MGSGRPQLAQATAYALASVETSEPERVIARGQRSIDDGSVTT